MQRRDFVKLAPAAVVAASVPTTALAEGTNEGPAILWSRGEELLPDFPEAQLAVYKDGYQISSWHVGVRDALEHVPSAGRISSLDSTRRIVGVVGPDGAPIELAYDAVVVRAPSDVIDAMRDADVLPHHWVRIGEPCLRILSRERVVLAKSERVIEKIVVSLPVSKDDVCITPFGSCFASNARVWYLESDGQFRHEEDYPLSEDETDQFTPDELHEILEDSLTVNGWIEFRWTDGIGHSFFNLQEGETLEEQLNPTRPARVVDLTKQR